MIVFTVKYSNIGMEVSHPGAVRKVVRLDRVTELIENLI